MPVPQSSSGIVLHITAICKPVIFNVEFTSVAANIILFKPRWDFFFCVCNSFLIIFSSSSGIMISLVESGYFYYNSSSYSVSQKKKGTFLWKQFIYCHLSCTDTPSAHKILDNFNNGSKSSYRWPPGCWPTRGEMHSGYSGETLRWAR